MDPADPYRIINPVWIPLLPIIATVAVALTNAIKRFVRTLPGSTDDTLEGQAPMISLFVGLSTGLFFAVFINQPLVAGLMVGLLSWGLGVSSYSLAAAPEAAARRKAERRATMTQEVLELRELADAPVVSPPPEALSMTRRRNARRPDDEAAVSRWSAEELARQNRER